MDKLIHDRPIVKIPNIIGKKKSSALEVLQRLKLEPKIKNEQYSENVAPGIIISQSPSQNSEVKEGRPVYLIVSKGRETVIVPYLTGMTINDAKNLIQKQGLTFGSVFYQDNEFYGKDTVFSQTYNAGTKVPYGTSINIIVSKGQEALITVPILIGQKFDEIEQILLDHKLVLGTVFYKSSETFTAGTIIEQNPVQFENVPSGTAVNIIVSK